MFNERFFIDVHRRSLCHDYRSIWYNETKDKWQENTSGGLCTNSRVVKSADEIDTRNLRIFMIKNNVRGYVIHISNAYKKTKFHKDRWCNKEYFITKSGKVIDNLYY